MVAQRHASTAIQNYDETVQSMDTEKLDAAKEATRRYNEQLGSALDCDAAGEAEDTGTSYVDLIDVGESLGYITIPKIDVNLPIYEGHQRRRPAERRRPSGRLQLPAGRRKHPQRADRASRPGRGCAVH